MSRIRILPENVANKIAAGEVVERPASVVKELLENALDADARSIKVEVESGGKRLIRVTDDGCGMNHDDALLAFERHATSKLRTADDLLSIATLGFRGEALPSIAAVSRLVLETRAAQDEQGTRVEFAGGKLINVKPAGLPTGTSISVADIFYSVPARRKFLKSDTTELGHIASLVTHYALAHPETHFVLKTPTQEILNAAPVEKLAERVYQVFGRQSLGELVEIPAAEGPMRAAITEQANRMCTLAPDFANDARSELAQLIAERAPGDLNYVFFTNAGTEANEHAVRMARLHTGRTKILSAYRSYHGATAGSITLTGDPRRWPAEPGIPGVVRMLDPYTYRCPAGHPDPCPVCTGAPHLEEILMYEGPETVAAVILEPVQNGGGCIPPQEGYFQRVREICDEHDVLLISDEVICSWGRIGHWFGSERYGYLPDIITTAKGLTSASVPMGAMIVSDRIAEPFMHGTTSFTHGFTFAGHPMSAAIASRRRPSRIASAM